MNENQLKKIQGIFKPEKMKIKPSLIKLPKQLSLKWETVGGPDPKRALLYSPAPIFLNNIENYQYNRFLNVGKPHSCLWHKRSSKCLF